MAEHEHETLSEVLSTEPIVIDHPLQLLRRLRWLPWVWAVSIIVCSVAASLVVWLILGQRIANDQAASAVRRAQVQQQLQHNATQAKQALELICDVLQRIPQDKTIVHLRAEYHCGAVLASAAPGPAHTPPPVATPHPPATTPTPHPSPHPSPTPQPTPTPTRPPPVQTPPPAPGPILCLLGICL